MPTFIARRILAGSAARLAEYQMHIGFIRIGLSSSSSDSGTLLLPDREECERNKDVLAGTVSCSNNMFLLCICVGCLDCGRPL